MTEQRPALTLCLLLAMLGAGLPLAVPARAETSPWAENEGGRMRMVALPPDASGTVRAALEIEPQPGWITYWREPGESGIPPQLSVSGGAALGNLGYPVPKVLQLGTLRDLGYDAPVSLPVTLQSVTGPAKVDVFIGLCKKICIPFQASFPLGLAVTAARPEEVMRIDAAQSSLPAASAPDLTVTAARIDKRVMTLEVRAVGNGGHVEAILTGPPGQVFLADGPIDKGGFARLTVLLNTLDAATDPSGLDWTVLLKTGDRAVEQKIRPE